MSDGTPTLRALLSGDHQHLEALYRELVNASEAGVSRDLLGTLWSRFTEGVLDHFQVEEELLFPALSASHRSEVEALRAEHDLIRMRLLELDVQVDLHFLRHPTVLEIVQRLRDHAAREDQTIYPWSDRELDRASHRRALDRLERWLSRRQPASSIPS